MCFAHASKAALVGLLLEDERGHLAPQDLQLAAARRVLQAIGFAMSAHRF
jgi:hypothetical protein